MHDDASPSPVYTTACKSVHLMPEALLAPSPTTSKRTRSALYALAAETHCQASIPLTKYSLWHQAKAVSNFRGMTPKAKVVRVPTALSALATMELVRSGAVDPD